MRRKNVFIKNDNPYPLNTLCIFFNRNTLEKFLMKFLFFSQSCFSRAHIKMPRDILPAFSQIVDCDGLCRRWLHLTCAGITLDKLNAMDPKAKFFCKRTDCRQPVPTHTPQLPISKAIKPPLLQLGSPSSSKSPKKVTPPMFS